MITQYGKISEVTKLPNFTEEEWVEFISKHERQDIIDSLWEHISSNNIPFPYNQYELDKVIRKFCQFYSESHLSKYRTDLENLEVEEKHKYRYNFDEYGLGVIFCMAQPYNIISNYFMEKLRLSCGAHSCKSPVEQWNDEKLFKKHSWIFWRNGIRMGEGVQDGSYRGSFRLGSYTATQFKPSVAKTIYEVWQPKVVCDTSCGWGDRLTGFYGTPTTTHYYGCDPNPEVYEKYKEMCLSYENWLSGPMFPSTAEVVEHGDWFELINGEKYVRIYNRPAEDMDWKNEVPDQFDLMFTSPPYFSTERYGEGGEKDENQSWSRYNEYDTWHNGFLEPMLKNVYDNTKVGGKVLVNIWNPTIKRKVYDCCDRMVDYMKDELGSNFDGQVGMRISRRPQKTDTKEQQKELYQSTYIENCWLFTKGGSK